MKINKYIDHTLLKAEARQEQIEKLCQEAIQYDFASVCVHPCHVAYCADLLKDSSVDVCTVIGFPLGANSSEVKGFETMQAIANGANEIDMVINIGALKDKKDDYVLKDIANVVKFAEGRIVKVILETCLLSQEEIIRACNLCKEAKADFVKTSTGFSINGATVEHVSLMYQTIGSSLKVKASGGIRDYEDVMKFIEAGASRIGTSNGVKIVLGEKGNGY